MSDLFSTETPTPQVMPGFEFLPQYIESIMKAANPSARTALLGQEAVGGENAGLATGLEGSWLSQLANQIPQFLQGMNALATGATSGFLPNIMNQYMSYMEPQRAEQYRQGRATSLEESNMLGIPLQSSTTLQNLGDLDAQLRAAMMSGGANVLAGAAPAAVSAQFGAASQLGQYPAMVASIFGDVLNRAMMGQQFQQQLPFQALSSAAGMMSGLPIYQPSYQPSWFSSLLGMGTDIASSYYLGR